MKRLLGVLIVVTPLIGCEGSPTSPSSGVAVRRPESQWTDEQRAAVAQDPRPVGQRLVDVGLSEYMFPTKD